MKLIKCDMCTELVGDLQLEVVRVGDRNYDLHKKCAKKLKEMLKGSGEAVVESIKWDPIWVTPIISEPLKYTPPNPFFTPTVPYPGNTPFITCEGKGGYVHPTLTGKADFTNCVR